MFRSVARTPLWVCMQPLLRDRAQVTSTRSCGPASAYGEGYRFAPGLCPASTPGCILLFFPSFLFLLFSITERPGSSPGTYLLLCQTPCAPASCPAGRSHTCSNAPSRQLPGRPAFFSHGADTEPGLPPCYGQPALRVKSPRSVVCLAWNNSKCPTESRGFGCP